MTIKQPGPKMKTDIKAGATGLGDLVADFTTKVGLDKVANSYEEATGKSCGCDRRQTLLNNIQLPF